LSAPEIWKATVHLAGTASKVGVEAELDGFDGLSFGDTQHIAADPYSGLCLVARATERLKLLVGVTNPVTRHPAVTATSIATVQAESGGRAVLGIGRGDSSLAHLGLPPATFDETERYVIRVQTYLEGRGEPDSNTSPLAWISRTAQPKVPVDVAATGPRMIGMGARWAERVTVNVGALPHRVGWALELAGQHAQEGRQVRSPLSLGAYLIVAVHSDQSVAKDLARGPLAAYAHFSGMTAAGGEQLDQGDRSVVRAVAADYDLRFHGRKEGRHVAHLDDSFITRFGVVGSPTHCTERLFELAELGLQRLVLVEGLDPSEPEAQRRSHDLLVGEVLPGLRERTSVSSARRDTHS
jgi:5,10-methylenetetrahydromethanopterin reductase